MEAKRRDVELPTPLEVKYRIINYRMFIQRLDRQSMPSSFSRRLNRSRAIPGFNPPIYL